MRALFPALLLILPGLLQAQKPRSLESTQAKRSKALLESGNPEKVAWGAYVAGEHGQKQLIPELRAALRKLERLPNELSVHASMSVLDAMIILDAKLPPEELEPLLYQHLLAPCMILMARQPKKCESLLLEVFRAGDDPLAWQMAGNLLAQIKSESFMPLILTKMTVKLSLQVTDEDPKEDLVSIGIGGGAGGSFPRYYIIPRDYPPTGFYQLVTKKNKAARLAAGGATPIYYQRLQDGKRRYLLRRFWPQTQYDERQLEWIATMLGTRVEALPFRLSRTEQLLWRGPEAYIRAVANERLKSEGAYQALLNRLQTAGLLTRKQARGRRPDVDIQVFDRRLKKLSKLPELKGVEVQRR